MHLEGTHRFDADIWDLWELLNDPKVLAQVTPGLKQLEPVRPDEYKAIFQIKIGPIDSCFDGTLRVKDKVAPEHYTLAVNVDAKIGIVEAEGTIDFQTETEATAVSFNGDAVLSGKLAQLGQRVMSGVARLFTKQFFQGIEKELAKSKQRDNEENWEPVS